MNLRHSLLKFFSAIALVLTLGVSMKAEAGLFGIGGTRWKEEVLLHDGSKIIVERSLERGGRHEIGQRSGAKNEKLTFTMPGSNQTVSWNDKFSNDIGSSNFNLMMLEIHKGIAYIVVSPMGCLSYNKWGRPNPPYVVFRYQDKEWKRIPLQELPAELVTPNVVISSPDDAAEKNSRGIVSAEKIKELNSGYRQPEYKTILREPMPNFERSCPEMIRTGDGWDGIGFFKNQPSLDACLKYCEREKVAAQSCPCKKLFEGK